MEGAKFSAHQTEGLTQYFKPGLKHSTFFAAKADPHSARIQEAGPGTRHAHWLLPILPLPSWHLLLCRSLRTDPWPLLSSWGSARVQLRPSSLPPPQS